jgi:hypothetical protein
VPVSGSLSAWFNEDAGVVATGDSGVTLSFAYDKIQLVVAVGFGLYGDMDMTTIAAAFGSVKALKELLQAFANLKIDAATLSKVHEALKAVNDLQEKLFEAREQLFDLQKENDELRQQIRSNDDWKTRENQYRLVKTVGGATVWESIDQPTKHFVCVSCFAKKTVIVLQTVNNSYYTCPSCGADYLIGRTEPLTTSSKRGF